MGIKHRIQSWQNPQPSVEEDISGQKTVPCGICRRKYDAGNFESFFAHLGAHFDQQHRLNRCHKCRINFVSRTDLNDHLRSAKTMHNCGYMFEHKNACTGHHPPHRNASKDDSRFDFCYRLQGWEYAQLQDRQEDFERNGENRTGQKHSRKISTRGTFTDFVKLHSRKASSTSDASSASAFTATTSLSVDPQLLLSATLLRAISTGSTDLVSSLFFAGATATFKDTFGFGPMHYAAQYGTPEMSWLLLQNGADILALDQRGSPPLLHAIRAGNADVVYCLLAWGPADVGRSEIEESVAAGEEVVEVLLEHWSNTHGERGHEGEEELDGALMAAVKRGDAGVVEVLLDYGARALQARDEEGRSPLEIAVSMGDRYFMRMLKAKGNESDEEVGRDERRLAEIVKCVDLLTEEVDA